MSSASTPIPVTATERAREQRAWYVYDWANSAYVTVATTVLLGPYLTNVAVQAAGCADGSDADSCTATLSVLGIPVSPGSLFFYVITVTTLLSALLLPIAGALADRSARKKDLMAGFAWAGAAAATAMVTIGGTNWQLGVLLLVIGNLGLGASLVVYDSILCDIATPDERDAVSSRGWALGYVGGGLVLAVALVLVLVKPVGLTTEWAVRVSLLLAGLWWAGWTVVPWRVLANRPVSPTILAQNSDTGLLRSSFGQLRRTLTHVRSYPVTLNFLLAYLFFNDGVQTVISAASVYGSQQLRLTESTLVAAILLVQFVAFGGALLFGRIAARVGAWRTILSSLLVWLVVIALGFAVPAGAPLPFFALAIAIGVVLGGTQALSRSLYSQLIPAGKEAEYFSLYQSCERGTSWLGTLLFGLVHQLTGSYRPALVSLVVFFVVGFVLLRRVDVRTGILAAGNKVPAVV